MPELPEVTTIINRLKETSLLNNKIIDVKFYKTKLLKNCTPKQFKNFLVNEKIIDINRKGKYILISLTNNKHWTVHLRMEGKLFYEPLSNHIMNNHLMVELIFKNKHYLGYYDSRMFGTFNIYHSYNEMINSRELNNVAIDPLDKSFDAKYLFDKINKINRAIKTVLLDQHIVSGIGNIYADEILFKAKIHPQTLAKSITLDECRLIDKYAKIILKDAIKHNGTTVFSFKFDKSHSGEYQEYLQVHTKKDMPCPICGAKIVKIKVNGRGTYFCPNCQKRK